MINDYYLMEDGQKTGPFSHTDLMDRGILPDARLLSPISRDWQSAAYLPEFYTYFYSQGVYYPISSILANFWWRLLAYIIDCLLLGLLLILLGGFIVLVLKVIGIPINWGSDEYRLKSSLAVLLLFITYNVGFEATEMQGSIGKTICKLKVINAKGERIGFVNALGRNTAKLLSSLVLGMGFLSIFWNKRRQGWHDEMAKTFVIKIS
jgi:uncharacterized RDD family membrane protein YckC